MVAWPKKAFRRSTRTSDNSLIFASSPTPAFVNARSPKAWHVYKGQGIRRRRRTELGVFCIGLDKVAATTNILQYESKDSCLFGLRLDGFQGILMMCKIKRVMHGSEQRLDVVVSFILFQEGLPFRRTWHEHPARKMP